jgi:zinc transport system substrate-binding protein
LLFAAFASASYAEEKLTVYTVNYPLAYMAQRIGQDTVHVVFPAPDDVDPAYWTPKTDVVVEYQKADLIIINGADYAKWLSKVSLPKARFIDTTKKVRDRYIPLDNSLTHNHGPGGAHSHEGVAFTVWLDLDIAAHQAERIAAGFSRKLPDQRDYFQKNLEQLQSELKTFDDRLLALGNTYAAIPIVGSHPVYQYLSGRYGFNIKSVHWEPDQHPSNEQVSELKKLLETDPATIMIWEAKPKDSIQKLVAQLGLVSVVFNPCGNVPSEGTFSDVFQKNISQLERALSSK